jgi:predicted nucleic acid-binding protein
VSGVVVDTSAWIDYLAGRDVPALEEALQSGAVILPPLVVAELVSGARKASERTALLSLLEPAECPSRHPTPMSRSALWIAMRCCCPSTRFSSRSNA